MLMVRPIRVLAIGAAVLAPLSVSVGLAQAPSLAFLGTWKINGAKSDMSETRLSFSRKPSGEVTMIMQGIAYDFRFDGKPYPSPFSSTATWSETGPRSWSTLYRMNNVDNNIDTYTLSVDGRTLTMKTEFLVPKRSEQTMTFNRVGTGDGLIGTWQGRTMQNNDMTMAFSAAPGGKVQVRMLPLDGVVVMSTDGVEAPVAGPADNVPPGVTMALKLTGARTFDVT